MTFGQRRLRVGKNTFEIYIHLDFDVDIFMSL